jgi:transposase
VDTLGNLLALHISPASEHDREQVEELVQAVQEATGESVELSYVDQGYTGEKAAKEAEAHGMSLEVVKHEEVKRGFVLLPRRRVAKRDLAWASRFRRLVRRITNGCPPLWQSCTLWRSLASYSRRQRASSPRVHNML